MKRKRKRRSRRKDKERERERKKAPVVAEREREGSVEGEALVEGGVRRDEGHGHEVVHEMELLGPGKLDAPGEAEREKGSRERASGGLQRHRSGDVQIPKPTAVGGPSQLLHPLQCSPYTSPPASDGPYFQSNKLKNLLSSHKCPTTPAPFLPSSLKISLSCFAFV